MTKALTVFSLWSFLFFATNSFAIPTTERPDVVRCPICGMEIKPTAKITFIGEREGEQVKMCSFACASRYSKRHSTANLLVKDYMTGEFIPAESATYLIKSAKVAEEMKKEMPPFVIAVKSKLEAKTQLKNLDDGEFVDGYTKAKQALE